MKTPLAAVLLLAVTGCSILQGDNQPPPSLDTTTTRIKTELINQQALDAAAVQVEQRGEVIVLTGFADSAAKKRRIETIARQAAGGRRIVNEIEVK